MSTHQTSQLDNTATDNTPDFGNGRYSPLMLECWKDAQIILGLESEPAERLSRMIGSEYGALASTASVTMSSVTFGKAGKDGKVTIKEAASKIKGVQLTYPLAFLRAMNWANEAGTVGFNRAGTTFKLNDKYTEWLDEKIINSVPAEK